MRGFEYRRPASPGEAVHALSGRQRPLAGGTDLLPLMKADIEAPAALLDLKRAGLPRGIEAHDQGLRLGALTTLAEIEHSDQLNGRYALLRQAAALSATRQIRNRATLAGNLLQRPRCWYFRNPHTHCWLKGGEECLAVEGCNSHHALFGAGPCRAVHPSDLAGCLLALDGGVALRGPRGTRRVVLRDFFALPEAGRRRETVIGEDELLLYVDLPALGPSWRSVYVKAMDRQAWAFALAGVAVALCRPAAKIEAARVVATGVAPLPWKLETCERRLLGTTGDAAAVEAAVEAVADGAQPLSGNAWKIGLLRRLLRQALTQLTEGGETPQV